MPCAQSTPRRIALGLACTVALSACGSHQPTRKDVIARGDAICEAAARSVRALPPPANASSLRSLAAYLAQVSPIVEGEAAHLRELPRPAEDRALLERYLGAVGADAAEYGKLVSAARAGDRGGLAQAAAALRASPSVTLAQRYGLTRCGLSAGTAVAS